MIGTDRDFEVFHKEWEPKMKSMASRTFIKDTAVSREDVYQELSFTLWKCFNTYDPDSGVQFNTYFYTSAKNQVYMMLAHAGAKKRSGVKVSLDFYSGSHYDNHISEVAFKVMLFHHMKDRQMQAAVEYILAGGSIQDLPLDVVKRLKSVLRRQLKERR